MAASPRRHVAGAGMQPGRGARGVEGIEPAREHRPGDAGEHVAHAAASHARIDAGHEMHAAAGRGDERPRPFQDHRLARDVHQPSQRAGAVRLDLLRAAGQQARRLPRMRREDHRHVALRERIGLVPDEVERVGVEHGSRRPAGVEEPDQGVQNTRLPRHSVSDDDRIADKVAAQGVWLKGKLAELQKRYPAIGNVRGLGLMIGIEMVKPNEAQDHMGCYPADGELSALLQNKCFENGLILERGGRNGIVLRLLPSLLISDEELKIFLDKFEQALLAAGVRPA